MVLFQNYEGNIVKKAARDAEQQKKFDRCMESMHLWYGNACMHIWQITVVPKYSSRCYDERGW